MISAEYTILKENFTTCVERCQNYNQLIKSFKEIFKEEINSPRKYEKINSVAQLFNILEDRDVMSEDNVTPVRKMVNALPNREQLIKQINEYEQSHVPKPLLNYYMKENLQNNDHTEKNNSFITINPYTSGVMSKTKKDRIFKKIKEEIGIHWRDMARYLEIREYKIDIIERNCKTIESKAAKVLEEYESIADPQRWFVVLSRALESSRRTELSEALKDIMVMNI